ncbi:hypothetical protein ACJRO7_002192 [Eucalyptus globulus]|uniref:Uncharacterized protein n=1 Tax=Eucalyptus globulus TaxID=34317 RepID=A0ABD3LX59_EUCGL
MTSAAEPLLLPCSNSSVTCPPSVLTHEICFYPQRRPPARPPSVRDLQPRLLHRRLHLQSHLCSPMPPSARALILIPSDAASAALVAPLPLAPPPHGNNLADCTCFISGCGDALAFDKHLCSENIR